MNFTFTIHGVFSLFCYAPLIYFYLSTVSLFSSPFLCQISSFPFPTSHLAINQLSTWRELKEYSYARFPDIRFSAFLYAVHTPFPVSLSLIPSSQSLTLLPNYPVPTTTLPSYPLRRKSHQAPFLPSLSPSKSPNHPRPSSIIPSFIQSRPSILPFPSHYYPSEKGTTVLD